MQALLMGCAQGINSVDVYEPWVRIKALARSLRKVCKTHSIM